MSGIFRFNSNNTSPNRRSSTIPYCASPGQLHDATADNSNSAIFGYRSPTMYGASGNGSPSAGQTSPGHRASLRDYDDKMQTLVKDNFSLKLRIYFMEQNSNKMQSEGKDALCKQIVDLKVETEALRAELNEKQTLICEAATALDLMDEKQKELKEEKEAALEELQQKNASLLMEIKALESGAPKTELSEVLAQSAMSIAAQERIAELERELAGSKSAQVSLAKQLEAAEKRATDEEEMRIKQEQSNSELTVANAKGQKVVRTLLAKQTVLENEMKLLKGHKSNPNSSATDMVEICRLQEELVAAQQDAANAHKWRSDCVDVCGALTVRLKELAEFLDSLLSNKDVLNAIAQDRRKMMRRSVDNSLDISKSVRRMSLSMTGTGFTLNDSTLLTQLTSLTDVLHNTMSLDTTFNDKENRPSNQFDKRSFKLEVQDISRVAQSESEDWSEPDRQVSHERIGLDGTSMLRTSYRNSPNKHTIADNSNSSTASNNESGSERARRNATHRLQTRIIELERQINERDAVQLVLNEELLEKRDSVKLLENRIASLEHKDDEFQRLQKERDSLGVDLRVATMKLESLQEELDELKQRHDRDIDEIMIEQRTLIENVKRTSIERHMADLSANYVSKSDHELFVQQSQEHHKKVLDMERMVQDLRESESEWKAEILEKEQRMRSMKKQLDEASLFISKCNQERKELLTEIKNLSMVRGTLETERDALVANANVLNAQLEIANSVLNNRNVSTGLGSKINLGRSTSTSNVHFSSMRADSKTFGFATSSSADEKALRMENLSPDLGIESDAGRTSGSDRELQNRTAPGNMMTVDGGSIAEEGKKSLFVAGTQSSSASQHNCVDADRQIAELRRDNNRKTEQLRKILENLRISNGRKEQAERDIRRELLKTHAVLQTARDNIEKAANVNE